MRAVAVLLVALVCFVAGRDKYLEAMLAHQSATLATIDSTAVDDSAARAAEDRCAKAFFFFFFLCSFLFSERFRGCSLPRAHVWGRSWTSPTAS